MKTPAGKECRYYYEDFHRGRDRQECRLLQQSPDSPAWRPSDCDHCLVPDILWANASEHLELRALVKVGLLGIGRRVQVVARCRKHENEIEDPFVGCVECAAERPDLTAFLEKEIS